MQRREEWGSAGLCVVPSGKAGGSEQETGDGASRDEGARSSPPHCSVVRQTQAYLQGVSGKFMGSKCIDSF